MIVAGGGTVLLSVETFAVVLLYSCLIEPGKPDGKIEGNRDYSRISKVPRNVGNKWNNKGISVVIALNRFLVWISVGL